MKMSDCVVCGTQTDRCFRCESCYRCDVCQTRDGIFHGLGGVYCDEHYQEKIQERIASFNGSTYAECVPVCPHCGDRDHDWWDGTDLKGDGDDEVVRCGLCQNEYRTTLSISYRFTTEKV